jgi:hypothetical protein
MASTYVNDLRLNEMATGDASGSWGTVTNTNLELIGEAFSYGTETIGDADSTLTIADGAADAARSFYLKITSSVDLTTTRIVTLGPNTVSKVWMIENATTGSQVITIKQGSGATINVPNGQVKMISTDGAGSGGAVLDLLVDVDLTGTTTLVNLDVSGAVDIAGDLTLSAGGDGALRFTAASSVKVLDNNAAALVFEEADNAYMTFVTTDGSEAVKFDKALDINAATQIDATVTVGVDDTGYDVKFFGATAGAYMLWDESADDLILGGAAGLSVNSAALVTGVLTTTAATVHTGGITMPDNARATFGTGSDFQLYHDGSNNVIGVTTGNLYVQSNGGSILLQPTSGEEGITIQPNSSVSLYYDSTVKLATTATGIDVTGTVTATGTSVFASLDISGDIDVDGTTNLDVVDIDGALTQDGGAVFNETGADVDFRVESDTVTHALFVQGSDGNVGIGTSSPNYNTEIRGSAGGVGIQLGITNDLSGPARVQLNSGHGNWSVGNSVTIGDALEFRDESANATRMMIDSSGNVGIGTSSPATTLQVNGDVTIYGTPSTSVHGVQFRNLFNIGPHLFSQGAATTNTYINWINANGTVGSIAATGSGVAYNTSSDYRLKEDWQLISAASDRVLALKPINFAWIVDGSRVDGFLAHELAEVVPEAVTGTKDAMMDEEYEVTAAVLDADGMVVTEAVMGTRSVPDYQGIDQSKLVPLLTAALQEALNKIDAMEIRLSALEG